jgi:hypothetical protein
MIQPCYRDGVPDLRAWRIQCDGCDQTRLLLTAKGWLIPQELGMCTFCPLCFAVIAVHLIETAFT